jgi:hypothetical protein
MAKSLFLGCAGALMALTAAQAADLPVKAKPVQYVKVCSLYGVGFYYIPGTDLCIKVGGYVREQVEINSNSGLGFGTSNSPWGPNTANTIGGFDRGSNTFNFTTRAMLSVDARNQTEYGTVRGYIRLGMRVIDQTAASFYFDRAVIQWAGFTVGRTLSFFDIFTTTEQYSYFDTKNSGDTVNNPVDVFAYTAQFGNGLSATISAESPHNMVGVNNGATSGFGTGGVVPVTGTAGRGMPDIIGQLRIDQNWGYLGVSGVVHKVAGTYYAGNGSGVVFDPRVSHPDDKYGWAAQIGGMLNLSWGDTVGASFAATQGAVGYVTKVGGWQILQGDSAGVGWATDGIFDTLGGAQVPIQLTNAWSFNGGYEHFWNQRWRTSVYGGYTKVWYSQQSDNIAAQHLPSPAIGGIACGEPVLGIVWPPVAVGNGALNSCNLNFSFYQIGSRTQWNVTKDFYLGVDVNYTHLNTAYKGTTTNPNGIVYVNPITGKGAQFMDDQSNWSGIFRAQYNFTAGNEGAGVVLGR